MMNPLRSAAAIPVDVEFVEDCLDRAGPRDTCFHECWVAARESSLTRIPNSLAGTTGHIAESVVEAWLAERGLIPIADQVGPGRHGVDLILFDAEVDAVIAVEVKGTLRAGRLPWLTRRELTQMSREWLDEQDNPTMSEFEFSSADIYGAVIAINFAEMTIRGALTQDFVAFHPAVNSRQLISTDWL